MRPGIIIITPILLWLDSGLSVGVWFVPIAVVLWLIASKGRVSVVSFGWVCMTSVLYGLAKGLNPGILVLAVATSLLFANQLVMRFVSSQPGREMIMILGFFCIFWAIIALVHGEVGSFGNVVFGILSNSLIAIVGYFLWQRIVKSK